MTLPNFAFKNTHYDVLKEVVSMNMNDTIFLFLCTLLVWLMTPGLSLFMGDSYNQKCFKYCNAKYGCHCHCHIYMDNDWFLFKF